MNERSVPKSSAETEDDRRGLLYQDYMSDDADLSNENAIAETKNDLHDKIQLKRQSAKRVFGYPITIPFIISCRFCERVCFRGLTAILMIYMTEKLMMSNNDATIWYHEFIALSYATTLLGAIVADVFLGKYKTILILSVVYCFGPAIMTMTAVGKWFPADDVIKDRTDIHPDTWGPLLALQIIALGTGGIKPCFTSLGGDQFLGSESDKLQRYFSMFYFVSTAGSTLTTLLTPELRSLSCMGEDTCYPIAFGVPAIFMVLALVTFVLASPWYVKVPPQGNPIVDVAKVSGAMAFNRKKPEDLHGVKKVAETKQLLRIFAVFIPGLFFYALDNQQGSTWVLQAKRMNGKLGDITIRPDEMRVFNFLLPVFLTPVFETMVYPLMEKFGLPTTATFRMVLGMIAAALSFIICGLVQLAMEERVASYNKKHFTSYTLDTLPQENQLQMLATLPQIFFIACGDILSRIASYEFAYSYAPTSMKSLCQSLYYLTAVSGNIVTIIFTKIEITNRDLYKFFMWAGIEIWAALAMFLITRQVIGPLEKFKLENLVGATRPDDAEMEKLQKT